jgi:hypothetical protein
MSAMRPIHKHDCESCIFLATVMNDDGQMVDWYIHRHDSIRGDSMVGRYSSEPSENVTPFWREPFRPYSHSTEFVLSGNALIAHALREKFLSSNGESPK